MFLAVLRKCAWEKADVITWEVWRKPRREKGDNFDGHGDDYDHDHGNGDEEFGDNDSGESLIILTTKRVSD